MPKYSKHKVAGYYLYYTSFCVVEAMHAHASDKRMTEAGSAKFWIKSNGDSEVQNRGGLNDREIRAIQKYIKTNYKDMYQQWSSDSEEGFFEGN